MRLLLNLVLGILLVSCQIPKQNSDAGRPNILFIMSDDHAYQAISAYSNTLIETPNIDRIAREGMIFTNASVTNSICAPSRATILTGKHAHLHGKVDNVAPFDTSQLTFPQLFQEAGYQTAMFGKLHFGNNPKGVDDFMILPGQGDYINPDFISNEGDTTIIGYVTDVITDLTLDWLKNKRDPNKPVCALYHQKAPHRNWKPAPKYLTLYDDVTFEPPANYFDDYSGMGTAAKEQEMQIDGHARWGHDFKMITDPDGNPTGFENELKRFTEKQKEDWLAAYTPKNEAMKAAKLEGKELGIWKFNRYIKDYLRTIKSVDDGVGEVLDYLEEAGLAENTIVVYTSDQGFYLGEHGWFDKRFMYEESFRTPLLMRYPKEIKAGTEIDKLVQNLDFAPTFLDYAGISVPEEMQGESFRELVGGKTSEWRDAVYYTYYEYPSVHMVKRHYGVATERYKLMHFYYDIDEWEMYDLETDPSEMKNIYGDPEYADVQKELHEKLAELRSSYGDSDENDQKFLKAYLDHQEKQRQQREKNNK